MQPQHLIKILVVGEAEVGKSALVRTFSGPSSAPLQPTKGVDFVAGFADVQGKQVKYQLWDTAGSLRYRAPLDACCKHVCGVLIVFSVTNRSSLEACHSWVQEVKLLVGDAVPIVLVGNKNDLLQDSAVNEEEMQEAATTMGAASAWRTSALRNADSVELAFSEMLRVALQWKLRRYDQECPMQDVDPGGLEERLDSLQTALEAQSALGNVEDALSDTSPCPSPAHHSAAMGPAEWLCPSCGWGQGEPPCERCDLQDAQHDKHADEERVHVAAAVPTASSESEAGGFFAGWGMNCLARGCR